MRSSSLPLPLAVAGVLLLTACGTRTAGSPSAGGSPGPDSPGLPGTSSCGTRASGASALPSDPSAPEKDGVRITASSSGTRACAEFEVTNQGAEPLTYLITFAFRSDSGEVLTHAEQTVPSVAPGAVVKRTVTMDGLHSSSGGTARAQIAEVRSVPADEAPSEGGPCPPSGVRVYTDEGDAAMGLRVVGLHLENCGSRDYRLNGYPRLQLIDEDHEPVDGVKILQGTSAISTATGTDGAPQQLVLKPGERARSGLAWRNTHEAGVSDPVNAPYVRVWAKPGAAPVTVIPELDLGTTGKLGVRPWKKDETDGPPATGPSGAGRPGAESASRPQDESS